MDDMEAMEEEITLRETASVVGMLALNLAMKHRQRPRRRIFRGSNTHLLRSHFYSLNA
jgi:hypothetical protein